MCWPIPVERVIITDLAAVRMLVQRSPYGGRAVGELDLLVVDDEDLFHQRPVLGDHDLVRLALVVDDGLIDRDAVLHVPADRVDLFAKSLASERGLDGRRAAVKREFLFVDGQVHLGESAVLQHADGVGLAADSHIGPVNRPGVCVFLLGDGLDLRPLRFRLECLPYGCGAVGELDSS